MKKLITTILALLLISVSSFAQGYQTEKKELQGAKGKIFTIVQYPQEVMKDVKFPLVILCHGFNGSCESPLMEMLANDILSEGMAVLRFDFNGHGKSEGDFQDMTVGNEIADLLDIILWAETLPWVESIALVGHSQGGVVVSMAAPQVGDKVIKCEVLMAPAAVLRDDALRGITMGAQYDPWNFQGDYVVLPFKGRDGNPLHLGKTYVQTAMDLPIYETAAKYEGPCLIVQGTHDRVVPYTYAQRYNEVIKNSTLKLIDGEDHGFNNQMAESCKEVAEWLKAILKPAAVEPVRI